MFILFYLLPHENLKQKIRETLINKSDLHYFVLLSEKIDDTLSLGVAFSLVFMMVSLVFVKNDLYMMKHK